MLSSYLTDNSLEHFCQHWHNFWMCGKYLDILLPISTTIPFKLICFSVNVCFSLSMYQASSTPYSRDTAINYLQRTFCEPWLFFIFWGQWLGRTFTHRRGSVGSVQGASPITKTLLLSMLSAFSLPQCNALHSIGEPDCYLIPELAVFSLWGSMSRSWIPASYVFVSLCLWLNLCLGVRHVSIVWLPGMFFSGTLRV